MATKVTGSAFGDFKAYFEYETSSTETTYSIKVINAGMYQSCTWSEYPWKTTMTATSYDSRSGTDATARLGKGYHSILETDKTYSYTRKTSAYTVTIKATTKKNISGGSSGSVSKTFTVPALTKYTITYNANGGSGAPSATYKYYGTTAALSSTRPTRPGYTLLGWSTSSTAPSATWGVGGSYTTNASATLYAVWTPNKYTVTLNPNGGTSASTSSLSRTYGSSVTLSSEYNPTRQYHNFLGWATSASATTANYAPGASYSTTTAANTTLYAVWEEAYVPATLSQPLATRVDENNDGDDEGLYGNVRFTWGYGTLEGVNVTPTSIIVYIKETGGSTWHEAYKVVNPTETSIDTGKFQCNGAALSTEAQYDIKVVLTDAYNSENPLTATTFISKAKFTMDINAAGDSVSIGEPASDDESEIFNVKWGARFKGNINAVGNINGSNINAVGNINGSTINADGILHLSNGSYIASTTTGGKLLGNFTPLTNTNSCVIGYGAFANSIGSTDIYGNDIHIRSKSLIDILVGSYGVYFYDEASAGYGYKTLFVPTVSGGCTLGGTSLPFYRVYATLAQYTTSDRRAKKNIRSLNKRTKIKDNEEYEVYSKLFDRLEPCEYELIKGEGKKNFGLVAQDVLAAMEELGIDEDELDLVCHDTWIDKETGEEKDTYSLAYENLIALLIHEVQKLKGAKK